MIDMPMAQKHYNRFFKSVFQTISEPGNFRRPAVYNKDFFLSFDYPCLHYRCPWIIRRFPQLVRYRKNAIVIIFPYPIAHIHSSLLFQNTEKRPSPSYDHPIQRSFMLFEYYCTENRKSSYHIILTYYHIKSADRIGSTKSKPGRADFFISFS